jgi:hypothetical protein
MNFKTKRIKTRDGWLVLDVAKTIADYNRLLALPEGTIGLSEIGVDSCVQNGFDTAREQGVSKECRELASMHYAVGTAGCYELPGY